jgi:hypothetical protein
MFSTDKKGFTTIDNVLDNLDSLMGLAPTLQWRHEDPPATDILGARLRAKYYGAKVITFRYFLLQTLEFSHTSPNPKSDHPEIVTQSSSQQGTPEEYIEPFKEVVDGIPQIEGGIDELDPQFRRYAVECIDALIKSTTAFYGLGHPREKRLIVTNVWGTAHA